MAGLKPYVNPSVRKAGLAQGGMLGVLGNVGMEEEMHKDVARSEWAVIPVACATVSLAEILN